MQMVKNFSPINTILPAPDLETRTARSYTIAYAKNLHSTMSFLVYVQLHPSPSARVTKYGSLICWLNQKHLAILNTSLSLHFSYTVTFIIHGAGSVILVLHT